MIGKKFGRLTVLAGAPRYVSPSRKCRHTQWLCRCDCGEVCTVRGVALRSKRKPTVSCGCLIKERTIEAQTEHGHSRAGQQTPTYVTWKNMRARCRKGHKQSSNYFERGITVCERWQKFENFLSDMGEQPTDLTLDRIDNDGNYEPGNCRWDTMLKQQRNRSNNRWIECQGRKVTLSEARELTGISDRTLWYRLKRGWSDAEALLPVGYKRPTAAGNLALGGLT
jgi:hypothetical protein